MRARIHLGVALGLALGVSHTPALAIDHPTYLVIVNPANPVARVDRKFLEEAFLKKATRWPDDKVIRPVDLDPNSTVRRQFSEDVLDRPVEAVKGYWQQRIFSGRDVPPPELESDAEVVKYVLQYEGAVGYVSNGADVHGAKVIEIE